MKAYKVLFFFLLSFIFGSSEVHAQWRIDFSRRASPKAVPDSNSQLGLVAPPRAPASEEGLASGIQLAREFLGSSSSAPESEIVLMHTRHGFIPKKVILQSGRTYRIHVVNTDAQSKNISFSLDAFSEHHGIFFGEPKQFVITPQREGVYSFISPEANQMGSVVVISSDRMPASE